MYLWFVKMFPMYSFSIIIEVYPSHNRVVQNVRTWSDWNRESKFPEFREKGERSGLWWFAILCHLNLKRFLMAITIPSSITWLNIYNLVGGFSHRIRALYSEINAMVLHDNILAGQCTVFAPRWGSLGKARMNDVRVTCLILSESCPARGHCPM